MSVTGDWTWFDRAKKKISDGTINLTSDTLKMVLCGSSQALSDTFTGSSGDCRKADLTNELSTANGYTAGGATLSSVSLSRYTADQVGFYGTASWTPTGGGLTFKYAAIYSDTATNDDLLCFIDLDVGGSTVTATSAGVLQFAPDVSGILGWL